MLLKQHDLCIESHINEPPHYLKTEPTLSYHHSQSLNNVIYSLVTPLTKEYDTNTSKYNDFSIFTLILALEVLALDALFLKNINCIFLSICY